MEIKIPNLGDGVDSAVVISILVKPGNSVSKDQTIIELEMKIRLSRQYLHQALGL